MSELNEAAHSRLLEAEKRHPVRAQRKLRWLGALLLPAFGVLAFLAVRQPESAQLAPHTRTHSAPRIGYYVQRGDEVTRGERATLVYPRDAVRFFYSADRAYYLAIFSANARGVAVYFPTGRTAQHVSAGRDVELDVNVELDDTLGRERVTALFCPETFEIEPVQTALASGAALPATIASCPRASFELTKQRAP